MIRSRPRRTGVRVGLLALFAILVAFAGCVDGSVPPEVFAEQPAGSDAIPVEVLVVADDDEALPVSGATAGLLSGDSTLQTATTDARGIARFWVEPPARAHTFGVSASGAGWTAERLDGAFTVRGGEDGTVRARIPVYHATLTFDHTHDWEGPATVQMVGDRTTVAQELAFANDTALQHAYSRRIDTITIDIAWENSPTAHGDFGVYIQGNRDGSWDERTVRSDDDQAVGHQGAATESVTIDRAGLVSIVDTRSPDAWYGLDTEEPVVAPLGLPIDIVVVATFRTPVIEVAEGVLVHPLVLLAAVLAMFGATRRTRRG